MDILKLTLERLLSWPVITFFALLIFKKPLIALVNRIHTLKAGREGFTLDATAVSIQTELKTSAAEQRLNQVKRVAISPSVQRREQLIQADIRNMNLEVGKETIDLLVQHLAHSQALYAAERTYRTIFGSQIAALKMLNIGGSKRRAELEPFYEEAKSRFPNLYMEYSFQQWLNYLLSMELIRTPDNVEFSIATDGKELLKWIMAESVSENKAY